MVVNSDLDVRHEGFKFPKRTLVKVFCLFLMLADRLLVRSFKQQILQIKLWWEKLTFIVFYNPGTVLTLDVDYSIQSLKPLKE